MGGKRVGRGHECGMGGTPSEIVTHTNNLVPALYSFIHTCSIVAFCFPCWPWYIYVYIQAWDTSVDIICVYRAYSVAVGRLTR